MVTRYTITFLHQVFALYTVSGGILGLLASFALCIHNKFGYVCHYESTTWERGGIDTRLLCDIGGSSCEVMLQTSCIMWCNEMPLCINVREEAVCVLCDCITTNSQKD